MFNEEGICNYCFTYERCEYLGQESLKTILYSRQNKNRSYDCIVGVSGGRDSAYALHYAVRELNLRVLAYTVDNGFIPEQTKLNIKNMVEVLGVEHIVEKHNLAQQCLKHMLSSWMHRPSPAMVGSMCLGCRLGLERGFLHAAKKYQVPLIVTGG